MSKIETDLPDTVLAALAMGLGFNLLTNRAPGVDEVTICAGHGEAFEEYVGTRATMCAFLNGFAAMNLKACALLNELDNGHRILINRMRDKLK